MIISTTNLCKEYKDKKLVLNNITFDIEESGKIYGLIGPNGVGKTTLVRILSTQLHLTSGHAEVLGFDVQKEKKALRHHISILPQDAALFFYELNVEEFIYYYLRIMGYKKKYISNKMKEILDMFDLTRYKHALVGKLSGGMIRRCYLSLVLGVDVDLYFLDEPTVGLDPASKLYVWSALQKKIKDGKTIFLTSHYMEEISQLCYKVLVLDQGKILMHGIPSDIIKSQFNNLKSKIIIKPSNESIHNLIDVVARYGEYTNIKNELIIAYSYNINQLVQELTHYGVSFEVSPLTLEDVALHLEKKV